MNGMYHSPKPSGAHSAWGSASGEKPTVTSGVRIGTPACTTRGFTPEDMPVVADCIDKIATDYEANREAVLAAVAELVRKHPIYE